MRRLAHLFYILETPAHKLGVHLRRHANFAHRRKEKKLGRPLTWEEDLGLGIDDPHGRSKIDAFIWWITWPLVKRPISTYLYVVEKRRTLGRQGWYFTDTWSLDNVLCDRLSKQLEHLANTTHGFPMRYETPEAWDTALRTAASALAHYHEADDYRRTRDQRAAAYKASQDALHWVADNLGSLWD